MRLRSTTTTTGATTGRVGPSGMAPLPWWRRVLSRRDRRSVRRVRQPGSRRRRGREPAPGRRALAGPALCAATGICSRIAYERVWPPGCWGFSPGRLYLFSPLPLPSPWSVLFPRRFREARWDRRPRAGVLLCRPARRRAAAQGTASPGSLQRRRPRRTEAIQPPPPHRRKVLHGSVQDARYPGPGRSLFLEPARGRTALPDRRPWRRSGDSRRESVRTWRRWRCLPSPVRLPISILCCPPPPPVVRPYPAPIP